MGNLNRALVGRNTVPTSKVVGGNLDISDTVPVKTFDAFTYTGTGATQSIVTGINSVDLNDLNNEAKMTGGTPIYLHRNGADFEVRNLDTHLPITSGEADWKIWDDDSSNTDLTPRGLSKVHIKSRDEGTSVYTGNNSIFDGVRGVGQAIFSNLTNGDTLWAEGLTSFSNDGFTVGTYDPVNHTGDEYVAYQTLYTHIKWGITNHKVTGVPCKFIEAFNPVTNDTMIMYEGSGVAGHEIPQSTGVKLDYIDVKGLASAYGWISQTKPKLYMQLDEASKEETSAELATAFNQEKTVLGNSIWVNESAKLHIMYGKAKSKTWTIVPYTGTGASGNFIECGGKPARVIIKGVTTTGSWNVIDNKRTGTYSPTIYLDLSIAETDTTTRDIKFGENGFTIDSTTSETNGNFQYIALVEFDTQGTGGGSYDDLPTLDSTLQGHDLNIAYSNSFGKNGAVNTNELLSGTTVVNPTMRTRATPATYVSGGLLRYAGIDQPRYEDGVLLEENASTNYMLDSSDISAASWSRTGVTFTSNFETAPDGTMKADPVTFPVPTTNRIYQQTALSSANSESTMSCWLKGPVGQGVSLQLSNFIDDAGNKTIMFTGEWQRAELTYTFNSTAGFVYWYVTTLVANQTFSIWGAQIEEASQATSYIPTTTTTVIRAEDISSIGYFDGNNYIKKTEGGVFEATLVEPIFLNGSRTKTGINPDYLDGKGQWWTTTGGDEKVFNGDFELDDTSIFTNNLRATTTVVNSQLKATATGSWGYASFPLTLEVGKQYTLKADFIYANSGDSFIAIDSSSGNSTPIYSSGIILNGHKEDVTFTATATVMYFFFGTHTVTIGDYILYDNITVFETVPTIDTAYTTPITYLDGKVESLNNVPQVIYEWRVPDIVTGKVVVDTLKASKELIAPNACTAWVNFNGLSVPPSIYDSYNIDNIVQPTGGRYTCYFKEEMDNTNYSVVGTSTVNSDWNFVNCLTKTTTFFTLVLITHAGGVQNSPLVSAQVFGGKK